MRGYTRWTKRGTDIRADIMSPAIDITARPMTGDVLVSLSKSSVITLTPDEARLYGVRLIEAATLADGDRTIREAAE